MTRAIVVGSGMAGLTAAAYLARDGCQVDVYEQADHIGGVTATIGKDGYSWDLGPMALEGFGPGEPAAILLEELGCYDRIHPIRGDRGLWFIGSQSETGPGVWTQIISSRNVFRTLQREF